MTAAPSKVPMPQAPIVDLQTGYATRPWNNFFNNLTGNANAGAAGTVTTAPGSGLFGGGAVATGISIGIVPNGVTNAMIRQSTGFSVLGRASATGGDVSDITATADNRILARVGGVLAFWDTSLIPATVADGDYGDVIVSGLGTVWTLETVNANTGPWGSATQAPVITLDAKGRAIAASNVTITPAASSITGGQALTKTDDTNVTLALGGSASTALLAPASLTLGWTGRLAYSRFVAATQKSLVGATAAGDFGEITLGSGVAITAGVLSATGTGGTVTSVSVVTANGFSGTVANPTTTPAITLSYAGAALTKTDDTNVTLSLGGSPTTALLAAASLTLGWTGTLGVARGGTNIASYAVGDILYASGATTLSKLAGVATGNALISGGVTTAPAWGKIGLTTHVSGTLPIANGGTSQTSLGDITKTDDTNVTLTLGGTPTGAVVTSTSFTLGWSGTLAFTRGGFGFGSAAQGDIFYADSTTTVAKLNKSATATRYLSNTGTSNNPAWAQVDLTNGVTGTLPAGSGGTGITSLGTGVGTALGINVGSAGAFVTFNGALGTPLSGTLTNATGLPIASGVSGLAAGVATFLATPSSANLLSALTTKTGTGNSVFSAAPTLTGTTVADTLAAGADTRNQIIIANGSVFMELHAISGYLFQNHAGVQGCLIDTAGVYPASSTTASAANMFQSASGTVLLRSTSAARYKTDIRPVLPEEAERIVIGLKPVRYRSLAPADDPAWSWYGLVAEEVAEVEPRLVHWAYGEEDYDRRFKRERRLRKHAKKKPDGVQYERVVVALVAELQQLRARVAKLEALHGAPV